MIRKITDAIDNLSGVWKKTIIISAMCITIAVTIVYLLQKEDYAEINVVTVNNGILLEKKTIDNYMKNLELIAEEKCNTLYRQYSYNSRDYSANIICIDKTEFDLKFEDIISYSKAVK